MTSSGRYQSRVFKTLQTQLRQLQDNLGLRWRQLKVATSWGVQLGLYPFYALFQVGRWGGKVFKQATGDRMRAVGMALGFNTLPSVDQPIVKVLEAIELQILPPSAEQIQVSQGQVHPTQPESPWAVVLRPITKSKPSWQTALTAIGNLWRGRPKAVETTTSSTVAGTSLSQPPLIQGVASLIGQRSLVLVTTENQVLDVLTTEQQHALHRRIVWEIAIALYRQRQAHPAQPLPSWSQWQMRPIAAKPQWSFPVRAVYRLMAWVQQQPIVQGGVPALPGAANQSQPLFTIGQQMLQNAWQSVRQAYQAALVPSSIPALSPSLSPAEEMKLVKSANLSWTDKLLQVLRPYRQGILAGLGALAMVPFAIALPQPAQASMAPALPLPLPSPMLPEVRIDPERIRKRWREGLGLSVQPSKPSQGKVRVAPEQIPGTLSSTADFRSALSDWAGRFTETTVSEGSPAIDVDAVFMGYHRHPLEQVLLWLDAAIAWIEVQLVKAWQWSWPLLQNWVRQSWL
ncbi:MAG TPA: hypothetical protein V6D19_08385 [Stenomitos sp.]